MKRVVVTGFGALSPLGHDWPSVFAALKSLRNVVEVVDGWSEYEGLHTQLGARARPFELPAHYNRKSTRSMGRVALMGTRASELALADAGLLGDPLVRSGRMGVAYGSSAGTPAAIGDFGRMIKDKTTEGINANTYIKMMAHTAAVNIGVFFGLTGRVITTSSACTLVLEELGHARARGARIHAEVLGWGTNADGTHVTHPHPETMAQAMRLALADAGLGPGAIGYVNAHGTATEQGDLAESKATHDVLGGRVPVSSLKSYMGHTLGACGALEAWMTIEMMREGWFAPTLNLDEVDPRCAPLDHIAGGGRLVDTDIVMSNNFAFGGINTSLIFKRWS